MLLIEPIDYRLEINRITAADRQALRDMKPFFDRHMTTIVDEFYSHIEKYPDAIAVVAGAGSSIDKLKKTNPRFFAEIVKGDFDEPTLKDV